MLIRWSLITILFLYSYRIFFYKKNKKWKIIIFHPLLFKNQIKLQKFSFHLLRNVFVARLGMILFGVPLIVRHILWDLNFIKMLLAISPFKFGHFLSRDLRAQVLLSGQLGNGQWAPSINRFQTIGKDNWAPDDGI